MDHELLRLECLKMAHAENLSGEAAIIRAQELFEFLRVGRDSATEARRIVAGMSNAKVKIVGVDNDQNFKDYIKE
jgi:hypothetical protein